MKLLRKRMGELFDIYSLPKEYWCCWNMLTLKYLSFFRYFKVQHNAGTTWVKAEKWRKHFTRYRHDCSSSIILILILDFSRKPQTAHCAFKFTKHASNLRSKTQQLLIVIFGIQYSLKSNDRFLRDYAGWQEHLDS